MNFVLFYIFISELNTEHSMIKHKHLSYKSPDYTLAKISLWNYRSWHGENQDMKDEEITFCEAIGLTFSASIASLLAK